MGQPGTAALSIITEAAREVPAQLPGGVEPIANFFRAVGLPDGLLNGLRDGVQRLANLVENNQAVGAIAEGAKVLVGHTFAALQHGLAEVDRFVHENPDLVQQAGQVASDLQRAIGRVGELIEEGIDNLTPDGLQERAKEVLAAAQPIISFLGNNVAAQIALGILNLDSVFAALDCLTRGDYVGLLINVALVAGTVAFPPLGAAKVAAKALKIWNIAGDTVAKEITESVSRNIAEQVMQRGGLIKAVGVEDVVNAARNLAPGESLSRELLDKLTDRAKSFTASLLPDDDSLRVMVSNSLEDLDSLIARSSASDQAALLEKLTDKREELVSEMTEKVMKSLRETFDNSQASTEAFRKALADAMVPDEHMDELCAAYGKGQADALDDFAKRFRSIVGDELGARIEDLKRRLRREEVERRQSSGVRPGSTRERRALQPGLVDAEHTDGEGLLQVGGVKVGDTAAMTYVYPPQVRAVQVWDKGQPARGDSQVVADSASGGSSVEGADEAQGLTVELVAGSDPSAEGGGAALPPPAPALVA